MRGSVDERGWRLLFALCGVGVPLFGVVRHFELGPEPVVGLAMRAAMSTVALTGLALDLRGRAPALRRPIGLLLAYWVQGWFVWTGAAEGMGHGRVLGIGVITTLASLAFRSGVEVVSFAAFSALVGALAYAAAQVPEDVPVALFEATVLISALGVGGISVSRARLEEQLVRARSDLERRVEERTADLAASLRRLEEASQAKSRFLANMSHELRTPLNAILGYTELVREELVGTAHEPLTGDLDRVLTSAGHLLRLVDDVLDLTRLEAGRLEVVPEPLDLAQLVDEVVATVDRRQSRNGNALDVRVAPGAAVVTDHRLVGRILVNLLSNALKFTERGRVAITVEQDDGGARVEVADTGIGIPEEALGRLFQRFDPIDGTSTRRYDGSGLGLALARDLARRLGGDLTVRSRVGEGSAFTLSLPDG